MRLYPEECFCCEAYKACQSTNRDAATIDGVVTGLELPLPGMVTRPLHVQTVCKHSYMAIIEEAPTIILKCLELCPPRCAISFIPRRIGRPPINRASTNLKPKDPFSCTKNMGISSHASVTCWRKALSENGLYGVWGMTGPREISTTWSSTSTGRPPGPMIDVVCCVR